MPKFWGKVLSWELTESVWSLSSGSLLKLYSEHLSEETSFDFGKTRHVTHDTKSRFGSLLSKSFRWTSRNFTQEESSLESSGLRTDSFDFDWHLANSKWRGNSHSLVTDQSLSGNPRPFSITPYLHLEQGPRYSSETLPNPSLFLFRCKTGITYSAPNMLWHQCSANDVQTTKRPRGDLTYTTQTLKGSNVQQRVIVSSSPERTLGGQTL